MSSYSLSLKLLTQSGNWDTDVIADEWHMLIKAYFATGGRVSLQHIFLPFLADSTTGANIFQSIKKRYSQTPPPRLGQQRIRLHGRQTDRKSASHVGSLAQAAL